MKKYKLKIEYPGCLFKTGDIVEFDPVEKMYFGESTKTNSMLTVAVPLDNITNYPKLWKEIKEDLDEFKEAYTGKFKVGDKVKVIKKAKSYEGDWSDSWQSSMSEMINKIFTINNCSNNRGYKFSEDKNGFIFPEFVLEKVEPLFYAEDFRDGSFPKKVCYNCTFFGYSLECRSCKGLDSWHGISKGEPIYEEDEYWTSSKQGVYGSIANGKPWKLEKIKYFANKENAYKYYRSLYEKKYHEISLGDEIIKLRKSEGHIAIYSKEELESLQTFVDLKELGEKILRLVEDGILEFIFFWRGYEISRIDRNHFKIGCISAITLDQIKTAVEKLKEIEDENTN